MKIILTIIVSLSLIWPNFGHAAEPIEVYYFSDPQCSLCGEMELALAQMKKSAPEMRIVSFDVTTGDDVALILQDLFSIYQPAVAQLPAVFIGSQAYTGYDSDIVLKIAQTIDSCRANGCQNPSSKLRDYYDQLSEKQLNRDRFPVLLFWGIFIIIWPILGGIAIVIVLKKYHRHLVKLRTASPK